MRVETSEANARIRGLRPPKPPVDPWRAHGWSIEGERRPSGRVERVLTVFLAGAECPFTCSFCDLWRYTIDGPTPAGAIPRQLEDTLLAVRDVALDRIKLYNASNFFDRRAVPDVDIDRIAELCAPFSGVTIESHASTIGPATMEFARRVHGRLEVAIGLETIYPEASLHLNKRLELRSFERAASTLGENGIDLRAFVLLGAPYVPHGASVEWTVKSAEFAAARGAAIVSIIPVRGGNGEMERLAALGRFVPPTLRELEQALDCCVGWSHTAVEADLWDIDRLPACAVCRTARVDRLRRINLRGVGERVVRCDVCAEQDAASSTP